MQIGERIAKRRKELGLSQEQLAHRMGYKSKAAISKIETNVNDVTQTSVIKFAEALDTSVAYLMGWEESVELGSTDERHAVLIELFDQLPPEAQELVVAQLRGIAQSRKDQGTL